MVGASSVFSTIDVIVNQSNIIDITLDREFRCKRVRSTGRQLYQPTLVMGGKAFTFSANVLNESAASSPVAPDSAFRRGLTPAKISIVLSSRPPIKITRGFESKGVAVWPERDAVPWGKGSYLPDKGVGVEEEDKKNERWKRYTFFFL